MYKYGKWEKKGLLAVICDGIWIQTLQFGLNTDYKHKHKIYNIPNYEY